MKRRLKRRPAGQARRRRERWRPDWRAWLRPAAVGVLSLSLTGALVGAVAWALDPAHMPLRALEVRGDLRHLQRDELRERLAPLLDDGFFALDVAAARAALESLPWVRSVSVRRLWPDRLRVEIAEQVPVARWGEAALVNARGEVFMPERLPPEAGRLPRLDGPDGHAARVLEHWRRMRALVAGLGLDIAELRQDARRAWRAVLSNGVRLELGRARPVARLARFVAVYPSLLASGQAGITAVDLRYSNGFAVRRAPATRNSETG